MFLAEEKDRNILATINTMLNYYYLFVNESTIIPTINQLIQQSISNQIQIFILELYLMDNNTKILSAFIIIFMIANIVLNHFFRNALFQLGANIIYKIQLKQNAVFDIFFYCITLLIDPAVVMITTIVLVIVIKNKFNAYVTVMFILLNTYLTGVLKAFYADPRPFWVDKKILNIGIYCPQQYGNPSGHSWFSTVIGFAVIIQYFGVGKKFQYAIGAGLLMIFVPLSRMYLGAHSLNQVLQGLSLGLCMNFLYVFSGLKQTLKGFLKNFQSEPKLFWKKVILVMHMIYIMAFLVNQPDINPFYEQIPKQWIQNIKAKCNKQVDTNHLNFMMLMVNSVLVNFSTGIGMGFQTLVGSEKGRIYLSGEWTINEHKFKKVVGLFYYYLIQISMIIAGIIPVAVMIMLFGKRHSIIFIFGNLGVFISGYLYSSQSFKYLFNYGVIRQQLK